MRYKASGKMLLLLNLLFATALWPQMPPQPGRLVILSEPAGAIVTINGKQVDQHTNATFLVSPGNYKVAVASSDGKLSCPEITLSISSGQTVTSECIPTGWKPLR
jgi:hypothetical protein